MKIESAQLNDAAERLKQSSERYRRALQRYDESRRQFLDLYDAELIAATNGTAHVTVQAHHGEQPVKALFEGATLAALANEIVVRMKYRRVKVNGEPYANPAAYSTSHFWIGWPEDDFYQGPEIEE